MTRLRATFTAVVEYDADPDDYTDAVPAGEPVTPEAMARFDRDLHRAGEWKVTQYLDHVEDITVEVVKP